MRNLFCLTGISLFSACGTPPAELADPPVLTVTSPARSLIQGTAGKITVTGSVAPNPEGVAVSTVMVNNVAAPVAADGSFSVDITVEPGATLIHTVATDAKGGVANDTRSVEAGAIRAPGASIANAITASISKEAFAKISSAAGPFMKTFDVRPLIAPMQPMVHAGDENGPDCLFGQLFVDNVTMSNAIISLVPVNGGLQFSAELDGLDVPGHLTYKVACLGGTDATDIKASKVVVSGTLVVTPNGMQGFTTDLQNPAVDIEGLDITSGGVPGDILDILPLDSAIEYIAPKVAGLVMNPVMNQALGALAGPQTLNLLGKTMTVQVSPSAISFTPDSGLVTLNMSMMIGGAEHSKGFIYLDSGTPHMNPGTGLELGIAANLANDIVSQVDAIGMLNIVMPAQGGTFDSSNIAMSSPPMISASAADGKMKLYLPDMIATFTNAGTPVGQAAINAEVELTIQPASGGFGVALQLGTPTVNVDVLVGTVANQTLLTNDDLAKAVEICLADQILTMSKLLGGIPLPAMAGLQLTNVAIDADAGYVMMKGGLQ